MADGPRFCSNERSVFYAFTPAEDVYVQVDTLGSDYDTVLAIYTRDEAGRHRRGSHATTTGCGSGVLSEASRPRDGHDLPVHGGSVLRQRRRATVRAGEDGNLVSRSPRSGRRYHSTSSTPSTGRRGRRRHRERDDLRNDQRARGGRSCREVPATSADRDGMFIARWGSGTSYGGLHADAPMTLSSRWTSHTSVAIEAGGAQNEDLVLQRLGAGWGEIVEHGTDDGDDLARVTAAGARACPGSRRCLLSWLATGGCPSGQRERSVKSPA